MPDVGFVQELRRLRRDAGLTAEDLAASYGLSGKFEASTLQDAFDKLLARIHQLPDEHLRMAILNAYGLWPDTMADTLAERRERLARALHMHVDYVEAMESHAINELASELGNS